MYMNKKLLNNPFYGLLILVLLFSQNISAQQTNTAEVTITVSIPAIALLDFKGNGQVITFKSENQIEQVITPSTLNKTWLNYSSIVETGSTNHITVHISSGKLPLESLINLKIGEDVGAGGGKVGEPASQITLSNYPQNIITNIGSCYTGRGVEKGHQLTYSWLNIDPYEKNLTSNKDYEITVTYTITSAE
ncbi:MAG: hypothetical protein CVU00_11580 [Bacteroidetes bacterium HGW-Bacteroidetes-17]|nr:MAG: hypothetical protein CVU00_11580 [Bacteroidetes bacterium HGW-Bacteroidetes-17]